jgi:hypothetical protein
VKVTLIVHFPSAGTLVPQVVLEIAKGLAVVIVPILTTALPRFCKFIFNGALVVPTVVVGKVNPLGAIDIWVAVPLSQTVCGLEGSLSVRMRFPYSKPDSEAIGLNVTVTAQLAPAAREVPQVLVCE